MLLSFKSESYNPLFTRPNSFIPLFRSVRVQSSETFLFLTSLEILISKATNSRSKYQKFFSNSGDYKLYTSPNCFIPLYSSDEVKSSGIFFFFYHIAQEHKCSIEIAKNTYHQIFADQYWSIAFKVLNKNTAHPKINMEKNSTKSVYGIPVFRNFQNRSNLASSKLWPCCVTIKFGR